MAFNGTYELQSQENFEPFMKAVGLPDDLIQKGKDLKSVTEIVQNSNHFVFKVTMGSKVQINEFTLGKEVEIETLMNEKMKTTVNLVDGKLVAKLKEVYSSTELSGDLLISVWALNDIVHKRISKRK